MVLACRHVSISHVPPPVNSCITITVYLQKSTAVLTNKTLLQIPLTSRFHQQREMMGIQSSVLFVNTAQISIHCTECRGTFRYFYGLDRQNNPQNRWQALVLLYNPWLQGCVVHIPDCQNSSRIQCIPHLFIFQISDCSLQIVVVFFFNMCDVVITLLLVIYIDFASTIVQLYKQVFVHEACD